MLIVDCSQTIEVNITNQLAQRNVTISKNITKKVHCLRCPGVAYFGAGHGICGILYMILHAVLKVDCLQSDLTLSKIKNTLDRILTVIEQKGWLPKIEGENVDARTIDPTFEHGIAGVIPLLLLAAENAHLVQINRDRLLSAALAQGQLVWERGFYCLRSGLKDGLVGCGYALHSIYRYLKTEAEHIKADKRQREVMLKNASIWHFRARLYADAATDANM